MVVSADIAVDVAYRFTACRAERRRYFHFIIAYQRDGDRFVQFRSSFYGSVFSAIVDRYRISLSGYVRRATVSSLGTGRRSMGSLDSTGTARQLLSGLAVRRTFLSDAGADHENLTLENRYFCFDRQFYAVSSLRITENCHYAQRSSST